MTRTILSKRLTTWLLAACTAGALSSGNDGGLPIIKASRPQPDTAGATPTAWRTTVQNLSDTGTITATAYVVCARTPP